MSEEVKVKMSIPMFQEGELETFDNNIHSIIEKYTKIQLHEKEQILTQRIIIKQEEEIRKLQNQLQQKESIIKGLDNTIENLEEVAEQKESIIKEVREYIEQSFLYGKHRGIQHPTFDGKMNRDTNGFEILEILDKEVN